MPKIVEFFACDICGELYDSREKAVICEAKGVPQAIPKSRLKVGDYADAVIYYDQPPRPVVLVDVSFEKKTHQLLFDAHPVFFHGPNDKIGTHDKGIRFTKLEEFRLLPQRKFE